MINYQTVLAVALPISSAPFVIKTTFKMDDISAIENSQIGDISLIPADVKYWCVDRLDTEYIVLCVDPEYLIKSNRELMENRTFELIPTFARPDPFIYGTALTAKGTESISKYYLCRLFSKYLDITPRQYIIEQRICKAKQLLKQELSMLIVDIALNCGFASHSHFNRQFNRNVGMSPKNYRNYD